MAANDIVQLNTTSTSPPAPSTLQGTGAVVAQGATTATAGELVLITAPADLDAILRTTAAITSITWSGGTATANCTAAHGIPVGHTVSATLAGQTPSGYSGTYDVTATDADTFTYAKSSNPGACTVAGTWIPASVAELSGFIDTFFANGSNTPIYVLPFALDDAATGIAALDSWLEDNVETVYIVVTPKAWDGNANLVTLIGQYATEESKQYFAISTTTGNYSDYADAKAAMTMVPASDAPTNEMPIASMVHRYLSMRPSSSNQVPPFAFSFLYGVTAWEPSGNGATLTAFKAAGVNYVGTGAEGGLSNKVLFWGTNMDAKSFNYWYSVDYAQINLKLAIANTIINGSNNTAAPLYYNQDGINRLQSVAARTMGNVIAVGLALGTVVLTQMTQQDFVIAFNNGDFAGKVAINAVPFLAYSAANPTHYALEQYDGISVCYTPLKGFKQIIVNLSASEVV